MKTKLLKYIFLLCTFQMATFLNVSANQIPEKSAKLKAEAFLSYRRVNNDKQLVKLNKPNNTICVKKGHANADGAASYYIFNRIDSPGFVIVTSENNSPNIIGYSLENNIDVDNMPDLLKIILEDYDQYASTIQANKNMDLNNDVGPLVPGTIVVEPHIKTRWGQKEPYNWMAPKTSDGASTPTGCVATATAQILNYYRSPVITYHKYDWDLLRNSYDGAYTVEEGMEVAKLMRDIGWLIGASYEKDKTSASIVKPGFLRGYTLIEFNSLDKMTNEINNDPLLGITSVMLSEHAIIVDGYDSNNYVHINWGWDGSCDGYYDMRSLSIMYGNKVNHSGLSSTFYKLKALEPKEVIPIPIASEGISYDKSEITGGDILKVTLHNVQFDMDNTQIGNVGYRRYINLLCYPVNYTGDFEYPDIYDKLVHPGFSNKIYFGSKHAIWFGLNTENLPTIHEGDTYTFSWLAPIIPEDGQYALVPSYYIEERNEGNSFYSWLPLPHIWNGTRDEYIPFEYKNGKYIFIDVLKKTPGDVDGNSVVNGSDVTAIYNYLLNGVQPAGDTDVDGNGRVNGSDVTALYNILLNP